MSEHKPEQGKKAKDKRARWYQLESYFDDGEEHKVMEASAVKPPMDGQEPGEEVRATVCLKADLYDKEGNRVLCVYQVDMEHMTMSSLHKLKLVLDANAICPALVFGTKVNIVRLKEMTTGEIEEYVEAAGKKGASGERN